MKRQRFEHYPFWTSWLFIIPLLILWFTDGTVIELAVVSSLLIVSLLYHGLKPSGPDWWHDHSRRKFWQTILLYLDTFLGLVAVILFGWELAHYGTAPIAIAIWLCFALGGIGLLAPGSRHYQYRHAAWHLVSAYAIVAILLL